MTTTYKYSLCSLKNLLFLFLTLTVSSLLAYASPSPTALAKEKTNISKSALLYGTHPLTGSSDGVVNCANDGSELHEIYLCGVNDERLIVTSIPDLQTITWSKLQPGSPTNGSSTCANTALNSLWDEVSTNTQYTVTDGGEYKILVRYTDNSTERFYFNVYSNELNPSPVVTNIDCGTPGSISVNNVPSTYEFTINHGATWQDSNVFTINSVSAYDIQIRRKNDTEGCLFTLEDVMVNNNAIDASATIIPISCNTSKGAIKVDISNASSTYVYEISQGGNLINSSGAVTSSSYTFPDLDSGIYDINVTLASVSACSWIAQQEIPVFADVKPEAIVTKNIDCTDGIITVTQTGGTAPYEYSVNGNVTFTPFTLGNQTKIPVTAAGAYVITVKDVNGCEVNSNSVNVVTEPEIVYSINPQDITCNGTDDGSISVDVTDTQGYSITYSIDGGSSFQTSNVFSNLTANTYSIIIKKQKAGGSCELPTISSEVKASTSFTASASVTQQIDCSNGSATIQASVTAGGTAPFEYSLDGENFQTDPNLSGLGAGGYTITVRDSNGCLTTVDETVNAGSNPSDLTFSHSSVDCSTGTTDVRVTVENGNGPFTYKIIQPTTFTASGDTFTALAPNTYTFEVIADDGCKIVRNYVVPNPVQFTANALVKNNVSCATTGTADGSIELSVDNFNGSFSVVVEDSSGNPLGLGLLNQSSSPLLITGLPADTYTLKTNDESGPCQKLQTITVSGPATPLVVDSFSISNINCGSPGSVTIEASGGWGNYRYSVEQPDNTMHPLTAQSNKTITGLSQTGQHTIYVTDVNGCLVNTTKFDLIDQGGPIADVDTSAGSPTNYCYSSTTQGVLKIDVSGGEAPYFYTVNSGTPVAITGGTFTLSDLTPYDYLIEIIGNNGCKTIVTDTKISGQLFALGEITKPYGCGATPDAIIAITPQEGYAPYTYYVNGNTTPVSIPFSASTEGSYTFDVIDSKGCTFTTDPVIISAAPALGFDHEVSNTTCGKDGTGSVQLKATGGTPPYEYAFSDIPFSGTNPAVYGDQAVFTNLDATTYYFAIKDALGCIIENEQAIIGAEAAIEAEIEKTDISCDPAGGNQWGNMKISNIQNTTGPVSISLIRVYDKAKYEAGEETRTWTYRNYENIDLATNSNYLNAYQPAKYGPKTGFDVLLYWANHFVVRIEDEKGCSWESQVYTVESPPIPSGVTSPVALQTCANGATYDFSITNQDSDGDGTPDLVGPFDVRLYPYQLIDDDGDGVEDDVNSGWRPFNDSENPLWDGVAGTAGNPNERDYRFTNSALYGKLLFGVAYSVAIRDNATGCVRWRSLRPIVEPPVGFITVDAVPQSETCYNARNGEVELTIANSAPGPVNIKIYNAGNPVHTAFHYNPPTVMSTGAPFTITVPNMRVAWYVVEVEDSSGCTAGERFLIYRPKTKLRLTEDHVVQPTCNTGGQVAVTAIGGWDDEAYFNIRNKLRQNWHPYEYALVPDSQTPTDADFGPDNFWSNVVPTGYTGGQNVYRAYVRDGSGCVEPTPDVITFIKDEEPVIDAIDVTDRCTSTTELYNVVATLSNAGTNPNKPSPDYIWDGEVTSTSTKTLGPGYHTLVVRDENGCSDTRTIHIYPQMVPRVKITKTVDCDSGNPDNGEIEASAYGGSGTYNFTISPIPGSYAPGDETNATGIFDRLASGVAYTVTVTDVDPAVPVANRCAPRSTTPIQLDTPVAPDFIIGLRESVSCFGYNDGKVSIIQNPTADNLDVTYEYSIDGNPYQTSNLFEDLTPGSHTINIRSSKNCIQTLTTTISEPTELQFATTPVPTAFTCTSDNNLGLATIVVDMGGSGIPPYSYSFDGSSYTSSDTYEIPFLTTARTITINVKDKNNCPATVDVTIPAASKISATITTTTAMNCTVDGIYEINIPASFTNFSIVEKPSASSIVSISGTTVTIQSGNPNSYSFFITDNDTGCTTEVTQLIAPFDNIGVIAAHTDNITCSGSSDGALSFTASGFGAGGFNYEVFKSDDTIEQAAVTSSSNASIPITGLPVGTYYIKITDRDTNCSEDSEHITIQSPSTPLDVDFNITQVLTCIGADAQVTLKPTGGWGDYEFELVETISGNVHQAFDSNNVIDNLLGISYQVRVRDSGGCITLAKEIIIPPIDPIVIDDAAGITTTNPSCPGSQDGEISVIVSRTNGPTDYKYILTNAATGVSTLPQSNNTFSGLFAGTYAITVQDNLNCEDTTDVPIVLSDPFVIRIDAEITQKPTCTPNSGEITVSATGNSGDVFEYQMIQPTTHPDAGTWQTGNIYSNLGPGTYEFIAKNQNTCETPISVIRSINVVEPFTLTIDDSNTTINCFGEQDAVLVAHAAGGLGGYQYQLEKDGVLIGSLQDSGIFENLGAGTYDVRATSGIDCIAFNDRKIVINQPTELIVPATVNATAVACYGEESGTVTIPFSGGEAPYYFYISTEPQKAYTDPTFENLAAGDYSVIVQDGNGCEKAITFTVNSPTAPLETSVVRIIDEVCSSDDNGLIEVGITGGTAPYYYSLGTNTESYVLLTGGTVLLDNLDGGFYQINIKDSNDCKADLIYEEVKVGANLTASIELVNECRDRQPYYEASVKFEDETLDTSEIVYDLDDANPNNPDVNNAQSNPTFSDISAGDHTISIVHLGTGCVEVMNFTIDGQDPLTLILKEGAINQILVEAQGGDQDYTYYFESMPQTSGSYYIVRDGMYTVSVVDGKGCETAIQVPMEFIDIEIPNFFTPNGDGKNDVWIIKNNEAFPDMFVSIYDRYGRMIKSFVGSGEWDGNYNKKGLPAGDYWYIIKLNGVNDDREFVGHFSIYR